MTPIHPAYETISERDIPEYRARGTLFRHRATGCELYRLEADDKENVFAFAFRTAPRDAAGAAHIVEHSVLCGSERYPVKDPFLAMIRRSLASFMNAFTYPDKTVYPAASAVEADYFNLMDVYGDAVFFPRLSEETFLQEAHHLELDDEGKLDIKGVVYNEMRGDYSSAESLAGTASSTSLFSPGHPYSFDSGGDPDVIPGLDYAAFRDFWAAHYHPSNCRIYLYGNLDTARQLQYLDERFLGRFEARKVESDIPLQELHDLPRRVEVPSPLAQGSDAATSVIVNWLTIPVTDGADALAMEVLAELLLGHDGSPLAKALRDSGLGEDLSPQCGLDTGFRQIIFSAGLRGAHRGDEGKIESLILDTLSARLEEGFSPESLDAAFHSIAFANREIRRGSGAYGLRLFNRAIRGWLHGSPPEATLSFEEPLAELRSRMAAEPRYLERLAERVLLRNGHRSTVTVYPDAGLLERRRAERDAALEKRAAALSEAERSALRDQAGVLAAAQDAKDDEKAIATLPALALRDLPREIERIPRKKARIAGLDASLHPLFTNGIVYLDMAFPLGELPRPLYLWLPFLTRFVAGAGLPGTPYDKIAELLARKAGGFGASLEASTPAPEEARRGREGTRAFLVFRLKALAEKFPEALDLALSLIGGADYGDTARVADLYAELRNDVVSAIVPAGHAFAQARAGAYLSDALAAEELWRGPSQLEFLVGLKDSPPELLAASLGSIAARLFRTKGLRLNLGADEERIEGLVHSLERAFSAPGLFHEGAGPSLPEPPKLDPPERREAYTLSAQVGFSAAACAASSLGTAWHAHETVLAHLLTTGALWEEIRVRRGAYGAFCSIDGLERAAGFSSYRDPSPFASFGVFGQALKTAALGIGEAETEQAIIGAVGRDLRPLLPEEKIVTDFKRELYGITDELRSRKRGELLATRGVDLAAAAERLAAALEEGSSVLISRSEDVELMRRERSGTRVVELSL
ncbi:MAG TPA: insulinase family protein [Rectinemataceae bacterium]|nr:insulinase family protein [Rectinemataceae bacterium]